MTYLRTGSSSTKQYREWGWLAGDKPKLHALWKIVGRLRISSKKDCWLDCKRKKLTAICVAISPTSIKRSEGHMTRSYIFDRTSWPWLTAQLTLLVLQNFDGILHLILPLGTSLWQTCTLNVHLQSIQGCDYTWCGRENTDLSNAKKLEFLFTFFPSLLTVRLRESTSSRSASSFFIRFCTNHAVYWFNQKIGQIHYQKELGQWFRLRGCWRTRLVFSRLTTTKL